MLPTQAWALSEMDQGGIVGAIGVGHGKTLLDLLTPLVIPDCKVAMLLVMPGLRDQLLKSDLEFYGQHWKLPNIAGGRWLKPGRPMLHVVAFTELSGAKSSDLFKRIPADTIIVDEAHNLRNDTARRRRFLRYLKEAPKTRVFAWSGTLTSRSLRDYTHLSHHALKAGSPTPEHYPTVEEWCGALDPLTDRPKPKLAPGKLLAFCNPGERATDGYRRRLNDTRGVIATGDLQNCESDLIISERKLDVPEVVQKHLTALAETAERPDGEQLIDAMAVGMVARQLSCGFFYRWRWPRKEPVPVIERWLAVRKSWHKELRERLKRPAEHMDSPLLLTKAAIRWEDGYVHIERDEHGNELSRRIVPPHTRRGPQPTWESEFWLQWKEVRESAQPETEAVWLSDFMVADCARWLADAPGLLWYEFADFGVRVARAATAVHVGPGQEGSDRVLALQGTERAVISIRAHGTGKNLQQFHRNCVANPPSDGATWEQLLGRTHRQGQLADEVTVDVYRHTDSMSQAVEKARSLAGYIQGAFGATQKLVSKATWRF